MGWLNKDKSKVIGAVVDGVKSGISMIDERQLTGEEAVKFNIKIADSTADFVKTTFEANSERSKARREVGRFLIYYFCFIATSIIVMYKFDKEWAMFAMDVVMKLNLAIAFVTVIAFLFGGYYLNNIVKTAKK